MKSKRTCSGLIHVLVLRVIGVLILLSIVPYISHADVPQKINYQGSLTDSGGAPIDATVSIVFSIYNVSSNGTALWSETQNVTVTNGVFSVDLGDVTPVNLSFDTQYYLGINVAGDGEMTPRKPLTTVGYAFHSDTTAGVSNYTTAQRDALTPSNGMMIYNTTNNCIEFYIAVSWKSFCEGEVFSCGTSRIQGLDGNFYNTILIGSQCWMAENLNVGTMIAGAGNQADNGTLEKYCYSDNSANCDSDGGLYQWDETMQYVTTAGTQGICPSGWHIPTDGEWTIMEEALGMCSGTGSGCSGATGWRGTDEGTKLKQGGSSGFQALLAGLRSQGLFYFSGTYGYFWSSTESGASAWRRGLYSGNATVYRSTYGKAFGFSVRCLKD